jgi:hypothetical protein
MTGRISQTPDAFALQEIYHILLSSIAIMYLSIFDYMKTKQNFHIIRFSFSDNPVLMEFQVMWKISLCNNWTRIFWPRCSIIGRSIRDIQYPGMD